MNRQRTLLNQSPPYRNSQLPRSELSMLEQENAILKLKCKKASQLQEKVEMVLRQNSQLLSQNQKMSRLLHQSKSENEILRNKNESLSVQKVAFTNEYEIDRKKLINQLERLNEELGELELKKNSQINQLKNAFTIQLQTLKRQLQSNESSFEAEIRKYRDLLEKRQLQLSDCVNKLKRLSTQSDYQILKLRQEKQKLKTEISFLQTDRVKQLENLKTKLENNYYQELQAVKRAHLGALQEAEIENSKLRQSLDDRGKYLEDLNTKYNKQRSYLQDNINSLKRENEILRNKIVETEKIGQYENINLKTRLSNMHQAEVEDIINKHQNQMMILQDEIHRLQEITHAKNQEIEQLIKEKISSRSIYDSEIGRVKEEYNLLFQKNKELQAKYADSSSQSALRLNDRQKHIEYLENLLKEQKANAETEQIALQRSIQVLRNDLNSERMMYRQKEQAKKEEVAALKHQIAQLELSSEQKNNQLKKEINNLKDQLSGTSSHLNNKAEGLNSKNRALQKENETLKNNISVKDKEVKALTDRLKASSDRESRLETEIDDLRNKIIKNQQKSNELVNDQKGRLESTYSLAIQSMKSDHQAALRLEHNRYKDLAEKLRKKQAELQDLFRKYKKMTDQIQVLTDQQSNKKDITLKYPGATADLIATKNLFDIYLKTKVLDVCGDALKEMPKTS